MDIEASERLFYKDNHIWLFNGDCRSMKELPDDSVHVVCTSPPYYGLRKYSGEQELIWDGDKNCEHQWSKDGANTRIHKEWSSGTRTVSAEGIGARYDGKFDNAQQGNLCSLCGAWKGAYGLEPTPEMYVQHTIEILREIRRVLRNDGVVWWNIGDSYVSGRGRWSSTPQTISGKKDRGEPVDGNRPDQINHPFLKDKDLFMIPQRLAIALQEGGWWVRSWIIWEKDNPMPESINGWRWERHKIRVDTRTRGHKEEAMPPQSHHAGQVPHRDGSFSEPSDTEWEDCTGCDKCNPNGGYILRKGSWRPTESHEYILMLTKSDSYYCDAESVREPFSDATLPRMLRDVGDNNKWVKGAPGQTKQALGQPRVNVKYRNKPEYGGGGTSFVGHSGYFDANGELIVNPNGRNLRSVWSFPTHPFSDWDYDWGSADYVGSDGKPYIASEDCPLHGQYHGWQKKQKELHDGQSNLELPHIIDTPNYYWLDADQIEPANSNENRNLGDSDGLFSQIPDHNFGIQKQPLATPDTNYKCSCRISQGSHFAVFPEKLPELCIKASTSEVGCCSKCGASWARITKRESYGKEGWAPAKKDHTKEFQGSQSFTREEGLGACGFVDVETLGWRPTCECNTNERMPAIILDPFAGAGTTLWVAKKLNRKAIGFDISKEYCALTVERNRQQVLF